MKTLGYMSGGTGQGFPFNNLFGKVKDVLVQGIEGIDCLVVWGGIDIHPSLYGRDSHSLNQQAHYENPIERDVREWKAMQWCKANNVPIIGVCRGAQMACAFSGGTLIQDVTNHGGSTHGHELTCADNVKRYSNSCHHQMMYPFDVDHKMLAWTRNVSKRYEDDYGDMYEMMRKHNFIEPEIVYFPKTNALAIQAHPEWMELTSPFVQYCLELVESELFSEKATEDVAVEASVNE